MRIRSILAAGCGALAGALPAQSAVAVTGPAKVSFDPAHRGESHYETVTFKVVPGELVPAAVLRGSRVFEIEQDACRATINDTCSVELRFLARRPGTYAGTLTVGDAVVALDGAAYGVGPALEADVNGLSWFRPAPGMSQPAIDAQRTVELLNDGDAAIKVTRLVLGGANAGSFTVTRQTCAGRRIKPERSCRIRVRLQSPGGPREGRLEILTNRPGETISLGLTNTTIFAPKAPCPCAVPPGPAWTLGIIDVRFAGSVQVEVYSSKSAKLTISIFSGTRSVRSHTVARRVSGRHRLNVPARLRRGRYEVRVTGANGRDVRRARQPLSVR
jgi:hypothetical protein